MTPAQSDSAIASYGPVLVLIGVAIFASVTMLILAHVIGPKRRGAIKEGPYESGMPLIGDTHRRFNVRFYIVAMLFLLFDVEVVFLWPWALLFRHAAVSDLPIAAPGGLTLDKNFLLIEVGVFLTILLVGYVYAWRKGVFRWN